jgi:hypothetical protein
MHGVAAWFGHVTGVGAAKSVRFGNKTLTMSNLGTVLKGVKNLKKSP